MRYLILSLLTALLTGCAIGIEAIGPKHQRAKTVQIRNFQVEHTNLDQFVLTTTNSTITLTNPNASSIIKILGIPTQQETNKLIYTTDARKWVWRGIAIDAAIFPIPLTIPLIVPSLKRGDVEFSFEAEQTKFFKCEYSSKSTFYGYSFSDKQAGFLWGGESGFWFNPD